MTCAAPVSFETLADYWAGDLAAPEQDVVEEHLFSCLPCTDRSAGLAALQRALGTPIPPVVTPTRLDRLVRAGTRVRSTEVAAGATVTVVFSRAVDLLIHRLRVDLPDAAQID